MSIDLGKPFIYAHELLKNPGGIWLGCDDKNIVEQAHIEGETGSVIVALYTEEQVLEIIKQQTEEQARELAALKAQPTGVVLSELLERETEKRCQLLLDSYDAGFIAGSGMCQVCDAAMPPKDLPSGVVSWLPIDTAPRDGSLVRLLVEFEDHATEDQEGSCPTIGANNYENDGEDVWLFAGWDWSHDLFTQGIGRAIGWLPMLENLNQPARGGDDAERAAQVNDWFLSLPPERQAVLRDDKWLLADAAFEAGKALSAKP